MSLGRLELPPVEGETGMTREVSKGGGNGSQPVDQLEWQGATLDQVGELGDTLVAENQGGNRSQCPGPRTYRALKGP